VKAKWRVWGDCLDGKIHVSSTTPCFDFSIQCFATGANILSCNLSLEYRIFITQARLIGIGNSSAIALIGRHDFLVTANSRGLEHAKRSLFARQMQGGGGERAEELDLSPLARATPLIYCHLDGRSSRAADGVPPRHRSRIKDRIRREYPSPKGCLDRDPV